MWRTVGGQLWFLYMTDLEVLLLDSPFYLTVIIIIIYKMYWPVHTTQSVLYFKRCVFKDNWPHSCWYTEQQGQKQWNKWGYWYYKIRSIKKFNWIVIFIFLFIKIWMCDVCKQCYKCMRFKLMNSPPLAALYTYCTLWSHQPCFLPALLA